MDLSNKGALSQAINQVRGALNLAGSEKSYKQEDEAIVIAALRFAAAAADKYRDRRGACPNVAYLVASNEISEGEYGLPFSLK